MLHVRTVRRGPAPRSTALSWFMDSFIAAKLLSQCITEINQYCIDYLQKSQPGNGGSHMTGRIHVGEANLFCKLNGHPAVAEIKQSHSNTQQHIHMITRRERSAHP